MWNMAAQKTLGLCVEEKVGKVGPSLDEAGLSLGEGVATDIPPLFLPVTVGMKVN